jgi:peptidoglycan hydrolase CwlO-like protein
MDLNHLINNGSPIVTVLVVTMVYFMPKLFKFLIHGKEMHRDELNQLLKTLRERSDSLDRKIETLEEEVEKWRSQYYQLKEEHAELKSKCDVLLERIEELQEDLASRPCHAVE